MLLTKEVEIKLTNRNVTNYKSLGYDCKSGDTIKIKTEHLARRSVIRLDVLCDYCLQKGKETIVNKSYHDYLVSREIIEKDSCKDHSHIKLKEVMLKTYGVESGMQLNEVKLKVTEGFIIPWEEVVKDFSLRGYILLSSESEYKNGSSKLRYLCPHHKDKGELITTASNVRNKNICKYCGIEKVRGKKRIPYSNVRNKFRESDFELLLSEEEYCANKHINHTTPLPYICNKHREKGVMYTSHNTIKGTEGCFWCAREATSGSNSPNWRGGITEIHHHLRNKLSTWKKESMRKCGFKCVVTGKTFNVIHHIYGFELILDQVFDETGIPIKTRAIQYTDEELKELENKCLEIHDRHPWGVCLTFEIHNLFHKIYGTGGNTPEQWEEFTMRYKNNEFKEIA